MNGAKTHHRQGTTHLKTTDILQFAYFAQCRCDPKGTRTYFSALTSIIGDLREAGILVNNGILETHDTLIVQERSRGRFNDADLMEATKLLGFGHDNVLQIDYVADAPDDEFIMKAWRDALRRSWSDPSGAEKRRDLNDAFKIIAEERGSRYLWNAWNDEQTHGMTPEKAYSTLEVPENVDEEMLITVYGMRVSGHLASLSTFPYSSVRSKINLRNSTK